MTWSCFDVFCDISVFLMLLIKGLVSQTGLRLIIKPGLGL